MSRSFSRRMSLDPQASGNGAQTSFLPEFRVVLPSML
jgi:hypothetical protein